MSSAPPQAPAPPSQASPRVMSLLSATTEIIHRLGCGHMLVGRSHGCDDPPLATSLPILTAPKVDPNASSLEIDLAVRAQAESGGAIYHIRNEEVLELHPTVIITQEQCRICAVTSADVQAVCSAMPSTKIVTIKPTTLDDIFGDIEQIATALGVPERGERLTKFLRGRFDAVTQMVKEVTMQQQQSRPRVVHVEWLEPLMGSGYWIAECVEAAGCELVHGTKGGHSQTLDGVGLLAAADVLVLAPCGFSIERTAAELARTGLAGTPGWRRLPAVRAGRVFVADGNLFYNRSSCGGVVGCCEMTAEMAHGGALRGLWGHHGRHFVALAELAAFVARPGAPPPEKPVALAPPPASSTSTSSSASSSAPGAPLAASARPLLSPVAHVRAQVGALQAGDWAGAFAFNSAANRGRLGGASKFEAIVAGSPSFALLLRKAGVTVGGDGGDGTESGSGGGKSSGPASVVSVLAAGVDGGAATRFLFDLVRGPEVGARWETEGVRIACDNTLAD